MFIINIINGGVACGSGSSNLKATKNRVKYFKAIAEELEVIIPDGFWTFVQRTRISLFARRIERTIAEFDDILITL
ncbi:MAG: hypothetical protein JRL30_13100 [Deltaproteobacteria bacterium]|nr:hypothetical protein [Deltaproteobacteria bacterium]